MDRLDGLVTDHLVERLLHLERLTFLLSSLSSRRSEKSDSVNKRVIALQREVPDAEDRLKRLKRLVDDGNTSMMS